MGVPKFFWSVSERYPCLSELVTEFKISDFDNLYLDMNGIIHACSHPNDFDPHFSIDEEKIFASIFHYIEVLFNIIKPKKLFFMAVDGVAPRAKMNQQRARRFRSAKEAEMKEKEALRKGDKPIAKERFDSNCITPGTVFMDHLHSQLKYFLTSKISTDPLWQDCKIILSGHQTPGEGEHKIMDYIRYLKTQPDYDENTRHCLYGLDADLIMLGMCTHEPHFSLLREKVRFTKQQNKRILSPDETDFYLLHLSLLREYLDLEFQELKQTLPFQYDLENIIDDWVLMGFLVGNDFIPHLPDLHLNKDAFLILYKAYKEVLPTLDGYLNENGYLNLPRFQKFLERMAEHDLIMFEDTYANLTFLEEKTGKNVLEMPNGDDSKTSELDELIKATDELLEISDEDSPGEEPEENGTFMWEFSQHKKNYYTNKLDYSNVTPEVLKSQAEGYVRAIQWILHYYYQGCQSWSWFYPHHYAPYVSDIKDFEDLKLEFEMGKPFQPFEQLLAVLPAASKNLLPEVYHHLMSSPDSPIIDFYPTDFRTDLNGKQQDWEAVVLIPFIDEKRLLEAMAPYNEQLTPEEKRRNQHGPMHVYSYTKEDLGVYNSVKYFPNIPSNHALVKDVSREEITVDKCFLKYGLRPGVLLDVLYPGFPTLKHVPHTARLKSAKVKVFERPSKNASMILKIKEREFPPLSVLANSMLGKTVYVNWPHLVESRAVAVSDKKARYYLTNDGKIEYEVFDKQKQIQWRGAGEDIRRRYSVNLGIELGEIEVIIHVLLVDGRKHSFGPMGKVTIENIWSSNSTAAALQVVVHNISVKDFRTRVYNHLRDAFPVGSVVFMLGHPHFGSMGRVLDNSGCSENVRLKVELETTSDPSLHNVIPKPESKVLYFPYKVAALKVGISPRLLSRITGSLLVSMTNDLDLGSSGSKINIGLGLKFYNNTEEIPGFTKFENDSWMYSQKVIDIVAAYIEKFSRVIDFLSANQDKNIFYVHEIFPGPDGVTEMKEMVEWIKQQEYKKVERVKSGTIALDPEIISEIEKVVEQTPKMIIKRQMQIKPNLLYKNDLVFGKVAPVKLAKHNLLDRVISIRSSYTVPTGLRGFIIGIHPAPLEADYMYDILFDSPFVGGMKLNCSTEKGFRMCKASFLNVTDAYRQSQRPALGPGSLGNLCPRPSQGEPKTSAFAQWTHRSPKLVENENLNEFDKIWSDLQAAKPQEDALKKILKIEKREKQEIEDPVKSFFERVTKTASESPGAPEKVVGNNQPKNKYYLQLFSYYQRQGLGQPEFRYHQMGEKVMAEVLFKDGKVYSGLPCDDKESACESAALQALGALGLIPIKNETLLQKDRGRSRTIENQMKLLNPLVNPNSKGSNQNRTLQKNHCPGAEMPPLLPDPPLQWVGLSRNAVNQGFYTHPQRENVKRRTDGQEKPQNYQNPSCKKQSASALEFVPLQAITGKRNYGKIATIPSSKQSKETQKKTQVVAMSINNVGTSTPAPKPKRKPKIAAKLNLDPNLY